MLALLEAAEAPTTSSPRLRAGLASGMAVNRSGDWFGSPVNLASRITGAARPGAVLVTEAVRDRDRRRARGRMVLRRRQTTQGASRTM